MSVNDKTEPGQTDAVRFELDLRHPPEKVWRALTEPALMAQWLLPMSGFKLATGATFTLQAPPNPGWDGQVHCRVLEITPGQRLVWSWMVGDRVLDTLVTFTLSPTPSGTRLSLLQSGFKPDQKQNFGGARYGWRLMGGRLVELLDTTP